MVLQGDQKLINRQIIMSLLMLIFAVFGIVIMVFTISKPNGSNGYGTITDQSLKAIGIVIATYIILLMCLFIRTGVQQRNKQQYLHASLNFASILIVPAIFNLMNSIYENTFREFVNYIKSWFSPSNLTRFNPDYSRGSSTRIITFVFWLFDLQWLVLMLIDLFNGSGTKGAWLDSFHFFTIQSNILVFFYLSAKWMMPSWKIFNSNTLLIFILSYIIIVALGYNAVLLPDAINKGNTKSWSNLVWYHEALQHMIIPVLFLIYAIYIFHLSIYTKELKLTKSIGIGIIYPTMYLIYALILPFVSKTSVYGKFSNINVDNGGAYTAFGFMIGFWIIFIIIISLFWSFNHVTVGRAQLNYINRNKEIRSEKY